MTSGTIQTSSELDQFYEDGDPWGYDTHPDDAKRKYELFAALPVRPYSRALDIGCGNGFITLDLPATEVLGIDLSERAIMWAQQRMQNFKKGAQISFKAMSVFDLDVSRFGKFDLIVVTGVFYPQYIGDAFSTIAANLIEMIEPGGIIVTCHIYEWYRRRLPLSLLDTAVYTYREYTHRLEIFRA